MESIRPVQKHEIEEKEYVTPLLDLYSIMVASGRCNTVRILSLYMRAET